MSLPTATSTDTLIPVSTIRAEDPSAQPQGSGFQRFVAKAKDVWEHHPWLRRFVWLLIIVGIGLIFYWFVAKDYILGNIDAFLNWMNGIGIYAFLIIIAVFQICSIPFMQGYLVLELASGFILGKDRIWLAFITTIVGGDLGMLSGFLWGYLFRARTKAYVDTSPNLRLALDMIEGNAFKLIFLFRLGPVPFSILNPLCGISTVPFKTYVLASVCGLTIEQLLVTYMGRSLGDLSQVSSGSTGDDPTAQAINLTIIIIQIVCTVALLTFIAWYVKRALKKAEEEKAAKDAAANSSPTSPTSVPATSQPAIELPKV